MPIITRAIFAALAIGVLLLVQGLPYSLHHIGEIDAHVWLGVVDFDDDDVWQDIADSGLEEMSVMEELDGPPPLALLFVSGPDLRVMRCPVFETELLRPPAV